MAENPKKLFKSKRDWTSWLEKNYGKSAGVWLRIAKKDSGVRSVSYEEALDVALCHGWIAGQKRREAEKTWLQSFVPPCYTAILSKINSAKSLVVLASGE